MGFITLSIIVVRFLRFLDRENYGVYLLQGTLIRIKVLANTLLYKMEANKVRVKDLTLLYYLVRDLVGDAIQRPIDDHLVNLGLFLLSTWFHWKRDCFKEGVGRDLLTLIFRHLGICLDHTTVNRDRTFMDETHWILVKWGERLVGQDSNLFIGTPYCRRLHDITNGWSWNFTSKQDYFNLDTCESFSIFDRGWFHLIFLYLFQVM